MYLRSRRQLSPELARIGGVVFVVATIQYFVAQVVAASAWSPAYNWSKNVISDLGNTACGQFSVHGPTSYVCSPLHGVMNGAFVVAGILTIVGTVALWRLWPKRRVATAGLVFWVLSGIGKIVVGKLDAGRQRGRAHATQCQGISQILFESQNSPLIQPIELLGERHRIVSKFFARRRLLD